MLGEGNEAHLLGKVASRCKTSERKGRLHNSHTLWIYVLYKIALTGIFFLKTHTDFQKRAIYPEGEKKKPTTYIYIYPISVSFLEIFYEYITSISIELLVLWIHHLDSLIINICAICFIHVPCSRHYALVVLK